MNRWVYNASLAVGVAAGSIGAGVQFGLGWGLIALGVQLVGLTIFGARTAARLAGAEG